MFLSWIDSHSGSRNPHCRGFEITQIRHATLGWTLLEEWSAHNRQASMPLAGLEPTIPASERPQTYALDRAATDISQTVYPIDKKIYFAK